MPQERLHQEEGLSPSPEDGGLPGGRSRRGPVRAPFSLLYVSATLVVVNKSAGLAVGGDRWDVSQDRLDRLLPAALGRERVFVVHRIDRDTSGVVVFALDAAVHRSLQAAFESRRVGKRYLAVVAGRPGWRETVCDLPLVPDGNKRHHTIVDRYRGKPSLTRFTALGSAGNYTLVEAAPETGRTHQIRVHLAALGHPVVCDEWYGSGKPVFLSSFKRDWRGDPLDERPLLARLGLHAAQVTLPGDFAVRREDSLVLGAPLPRDLAALVHQMEKAAGPFPGLEDLVTPASAPGAESTG